MSRTANVSRAKWTIMIYMAADDEPEPPDYDAPAYDAAIAFRRELHWIGQTIDEMGGAANVNVLLQVYMDWDTRQNQKNYSAKRFKVQTDFEASDPIEDLGNIKMGDAEELSSFISFCKEEYPAQRYLLLLWGHGTGSGMFQAELERFFRELKEKLPFFDMTLESGQPVTVRELINNKYNSFISKFEDEEGVAMETKFRIRYPDEETGGETSDIITLTKRTMGSFKDKPKYFLSAEKPDTLNNLQRYVSTRSNLDALIGRELNQSLEDSFGDTGKIDLIVILGCCMQMVEFGFEIRRHCKYYVASEELIFFDGYNYFDTFMSLIENPVMTTEDLGEKFINDTPDKRDDQDRNVYTLEERKFLAISCVDLQKSRQLATKINSIARDLLEDSDGLRALIRNSRIRCSHFGEQSYMSSFIDIVWFFKSMLFHMGNNQDYDSLRSKIVDVIRFLESEYIVAKYIGERKIPKPEQRRSLGGHGVGIYFPQSLDDFLDDEERGKYFDKREADYVNTFSQQNSWNIVIFNYIGLPQDGPFV